MKLKNFLPFDKFTIATGLTATEVLARISDNVATRDRSIFRFNDNKGKPYIGKISSNHFEITRIIAYRNSFPPLIKGHILIYSNKTEIIIKMRPVAFVLIFMSFWLGIVGIVCIGIIIAAIAQFKQVLQHEIWPPIVIPLSCLFLDTGC